MDVRTQMCSAARYNAKREAIVASDRRLTFDEAWQRGLRLANGLLALELAPQDRVGVLEDNSLEASDFFLGAAIANLVRVPLYPRNSRESHLHMLSHTACKAVVVAEKYAGEIAAVREELPELANMVVRDAGYEAWLAAQSDVDPDGPIDPEDNYIIRHTGGTTGKSKGVAYTHRAWLAAARDWFYLCPPVEPGDSCLHLAPISHGSGYLFRPMWLGGGCNVMAEKFDPANLPDVMARESAICSWFRPSSIRSIAFPASRVAASPTSNP
jgi:acyl-CoA synthetase (AMP-forming)/AMP-acid ligase II